MAANDISGIDHGSGVYKDILDRISEAIFICDSKMTVLQMNLAAEKLTDTTRGEAQGKDICRLFPDSEAFRKSCPIEKVISGSSALEGLVAAITVRGGKSVDVRISITPFNGGAYVMMEQISDLKELELYRMMIEKSGDPVFLIDDDDNCRMIYVNEAAVNHFGVPREEILQWRIPDWDPNFSYKDLPRHVEEVKKIKNLFIESIHRVKGGEEVVPVEISLNHVQYRGRTCHFGYFKNISDRKKAEAELLRAKNEAEAANLAKSQFLASMSHELRTPLNSILGFAQLMEFNKSDPLTDKQKEFIHHIIKGGDHLLSLIDEVLDLARIESGKMTISMEEIDLGQVIDDVVAVIHPMAEERGITIENRCRCRGHLISADLTRLKQVLMNLMTNAVKYNRERGRVAVWCAEADGHMERIWVEDTGRGIAPEDLKSLFEPFSRLGAEGSNIEGTGIGLTITKKLMELMDGRIGVESVFGSGTRFYVDFKKLSSVKKGEVAMEQPASAGNTAPTSDKRFKVLYVEDNPANLKVVGYVFEQRPDIQLFSAPDAIMGIDLARAHKPDLILMDLNLPGMSGLEAIKLLQEIEETRDIPVVAVSANAMPKDIEKALSLGFKEYLTKPFKINMLMEMIDRMLKR